MADHWIEIRATTTNAATSNPSGGYTPACWRISTGGDLTESWSPSSGVHGGGTGNVLSASSQRMQFNYGDRFNIAVITTDLAAISGVNIGTGNVCYNTAGSGSQTYDGVTYTYVSGGGANLPYDSSNSSTGALRFNSGLITCNTAGNFMYRIRIAKGNSQGNQQFSFVWTVQADVPAAGVPTNVSISDAYNQSCTLAWNSANPYNASYNSGVIVSPELGTRTDSDGDPINDTTPQSWAGSVVQATVTRGWSYRIYARNFSALSKADGTMLNWISNNTYHQYKYQNNDSNSWAATPGGADTQVVPYKSAGSLDASDPVINIGWLSTTSHTATVQVNTGPWTYYQSRLVDGTTVKAESYSTLSNNNVTSVSGQVPLKHPSYSYLNPTGGAGTYYVWQMLPIAKGGTGVWAATGNSYVVPDGADYVPTQFDLGADITNAPTAQNYESAEITIAGVTANVNIAVSLTQSNNSNNWGFFKYDDGSGYSAYIQAGETGHNVQLGSKVKVKLPSSNIRNDYRGIKLSIGSTYDWFKVTTAAAAATDDDENVSGSTGYGLEILSPKSANTANATGSVVTYGPNNRATWLVTHNTFDIAAGATYTITVTGMSATNKGDFHLFTQDPSPLSYLTGSGLTVTRTNTGFTVSATAARTGVYYMVYRV